MRNVAVIGMGHVGATVAFTLFTHGIVDNLYLLDKNQAKAEAEYNDLRDTLARNDYHVNVFLGDYNDLKNVDIFVTSFGDIAATAAFQKTLSWMAFPCCPGCKIRNRASHIKI